MLAQRQHDSCPDASRPGNSEPPLLMREQPWNKQYSCLLRLKVSVPHRPLRHCPSRWIVGWRKWSELHLNPGPLFHSRRPLVANCECGRPPAARQIGVTDKRNGECLRGGRRSEQVEPSNRAEDNTYRNQPNKFSASHGYQQVFNFICSPPARSFLLDWVSLYARIRTVSSRENRRRAAWNYGSFTPWPH